MKILYATDGSDNSLAGARLLAALRLGPSDLIRVLSLASSADTSAAAAAVAAAAALLPSDSAHIDTLVRGGHTSEQILRAAAELHADLVVLGARGHSGLAALLLGSVSDVVLRQAPCPVLLARPLSGELHRVILGTDGSPGSNRAAELLARLPLPDGCEVRLLTLLPAFDQIAREHVAVSPPLTAEATTLADLQRQEAQKHLDSVETLLRNSGKSTVTEIRGTDPAEGLLAASQQEGADLLVIGSHTQTPLERFFLGSVSETLAHQAPCSVLVVR